MSQIDSHDGERQIIEPIHTNGLVALLDGWEPLEEDFPYVADEAPVPEEIV